MQVTRLTEEEMEKLRARVAPVVERFTDTIGADLVAQAREAMAAGR